MRMIIVLKDQFFDCLEVSFGCLWDDTEQAKPTQLKPMGRKGATQKEQLHFERV